MTKEARTLEQRLKFDYGLPIGQSLVKFTCEGNERIALVNISPRGIVRLLMKPREEDMYSSWDRVKGDINKQDGNTIVWAARNPDMMQVFNGDPVATIPLIRKVQS